MIEDELRQLCLSLLGQLAITTPIDPVELCRRLGEWRARPIVLEPRRLPGAETFGFGSLLPMRSKDVIVYPADVSPPWQAWIIFHEVVHLVRGHVGGDGDRRPLLCGTAAERDVDEPGSTAYYGSQEEWEAETGAAILAGLSSNPGRVLRPDRDDLTDAERAYTRAIGGTGDS